MSAPLPEGAYEAVLLWTTRGTEKPYIGQMMHFVLVDTGERCTAFVLSHHLGNIAGRSGMQVEMIKGQHTYRKALAREQPIFKLNLGVSKVATFNYLTGIAPTGRTIACDIACPPKHEVEEF